MKLTPTMEQGLRAMAEKVNRYGVNVTPATPDMFAAMQLEYHGLIKHVERGWYSITDAGRAWLAENGDWENWTGGKIPLHRNELIEVVYRDKEKCTAHAGEFKWLHDGDIDDVVMFRVISKSNENGGAE